MESNLLWGNASGYEMKVVSSTVKRRKESESKTKNGTKKLFELKKQTNRSFRTRLAIPRSTYTTFHSSIPVPVIQHRDTQTTLTLGQA